MPLPNAAHVSLYVALISGDRRPFGMSVRASEPCARAAARGFFLKVPCGRKDKGRIGHGPR